jgi:hypothetical protein
LDRLDRLVRQNPFDQLNLLAPGRLVPLTRLYRLDLSALEDHSAPWDRLDLFVQWYLYGLYILLDRLDRLNRNLLFHLGRSHLYNQLNQFDHLNLLHLYFQLYLSGLFDLFDQFDPCFQ